MFGFLFKRANRSAAAAQSEVAQKALQHAALRVASAQATDSARQRALTQAAALTEESAAVAFILQADFADARLQAAQLVQSVAGLEQVLQAMRNVDRRVAKLMQTRLDVLRKEQKTAVQASVCLQQAQRLLQEQQLLPNQVADLDRAWQSIEMPAEAQQQEFTQISAALAQRLSAQAELQRSVLGFLARLRQISQQISAEPQAQTADAIALQAEQIEAQMRQHESSTEANSLPKNLASEFAVALQDLRQLLQGLQQHQQALNARQELLTQWEAMPAETLKPEFLRRSWAGQASLPAAFIDETLEQRYQNLLQQSIAANLPKNMPPSALPGQAADKPVSQEQYSAALDGLEAALEEGALQAAMDYDKTLRAMDFKAMASSQSARLGQARSELGRLQGWARWGGNVSREELMKAAQELPGQALATTELAKKIGSLRARWKSLDSSAGSAPKVLWDGFDAACTAAYAPVAAHFQQLAEERQLNQARALAVIAEVQEYADQALNEIENGAAPDWKAIAQFCQQKQQAWRNLGTLNRSEKKSLDKAFAGASQRLLAPLTLQQQLEIGKREQLITEASELPPNQRDTTERLRALQQRWQEQAKALPLARQDEQLLWQRFRSACDTIFAQRKEAASTADSERRRNLQVKEELCASLEIAATQAEAALPKILRQAQQDWSKAGAVPRAAEADIEARYSAAVAKLQALLDQAQRNADIAQAHALCDKLALCQLVEVSLGLEPDADADGNPDTWHANWQALPVLPTAFEKAMRIRFDTALNLHRAAERQAIEAYLATLESNREALLQELLRAEIVAGVDSPSSLLRERLQLQVEVLQASLKAGVAEVSNSAQLLRACGLPAMMDGVTRERAQQLIMSVKGLN